MTCPHAIDPELIDFYADRPDLVCARCFGWRDDAPAEPVVPEPAKPRTKHPPASIAPGGGLFETGEALELY